jgi:hypothetical protein
MVTASGLQRGAWADGQVPHPQMPRMVTCRESSANQVYIPGSSCSTRSRKRFTIPVTAGAVDSLNHDANCLIVSLVLGSCTPLADELGDACIPSRMNANITGGAAGCWLLHLPPCLSTWECLVTARLKAGVLGFRGTRPWLSHNTSSVGGCT